MKLGLKLPLALALAQCLVLGAALVEQSAAAAESLKQQSQQLVQVVAVFRLGSPGMHHLLGVPAAGIGGASRV